MSADCDPIVLVSGPGSYGAANRAAPLMQASKALVESPLGLVA